MNETDSALAAFKTMVSSNVSGLAVVDSSGRLVDTISVRDLRGMGASAADWTALWLSVKEFKQLCRQKFPQQTPDKPITVSGKDTLETLIKKMDVRQTSEAAASIGSARLIRTRRAACDCAVSL